METPDEPRDEPRELTLTITFKIGTLAQIGLGGLKQPWIDAKRDGREYDLTCGAGLGSSHLEAHVRDGKRNLYARASIKPLATDLFNALNSALDDVGSQPAGKE